MFLPLGNAYFSVRLFLKSHKAMSRIIQWRMKRMNLNIHSHELQTTYINTNDPCTKDKQVHVIVKVGKNKKKQLMYRKENKDLFTWCDYYVGFLIAMDKVSLSQ